jgi:predicted negative regulator of RcsB-dependent stress response
MAAELYDDIEQAERVKSWLREHGGGILLGLVLALGAVFGWRWWQARELARDLEAASIYYLIEDALNAPAADADPASIDAGFEQLRTDHPDNLYTALAALQLADRRVRDGELESAVELFDAVRAGGTPLGSIAALRKARVLIDLERFDEALRLLDGLADADAYAAVVARTRAEALFARGDRESALAAYREVEEALGGRPDRLVALRLQTLESPDVDALLDTAQPLPPPLADALGTLPDAVPSGDEGS